MPDNDLLEMVIDRLDAIEAKLDRVIDGKALSDSRLAIVEERAVGMRDLAVRVAVLEEQQKGQTSKLEKILDSAWKLIVAIAGGAIAIK